MKHTTKISKSNNIWLSHRKNIHLLENDYLSFYTVTGITMALRTDINGFQNALAFLVFFLHSWGMILQDKLQLGENAKVKHLSLIR